MYMNNLTITEGPIAQNVTFTGLQWAQFTSAVNQAMAQALHAGLILGFLAGVIGVFAALKYMEWKRAKEWEDYGKS